jgi:hypothetical protein
MNRNTKKANDLIPLNIPLCLKAHSGNHIQNEFCWRNALCRNQNTEAREQLILLKTDDDKIIIQSRWNNRNIQVQESGRCEFANHNKCLWEKFDVEIDDDENYYFVSCHTGKVMQCNEHGRAWCVNTNRQAWEAWKIVYPQNKAMLTSKGLGMILLAATGGVFGLAVLPCIGLAAAALVPASMSTFGTVVAGVGTIHAPLSALGVSAILQTSAVSLVTPAAALVGGAVGATGGLVIANAGNESNTTEPK